MPDTTTRTISFRVTFREAKEISAKAGTQSLGDYARTASLGRLHEDRIAERAAIGKLIQAAHQAMHEELQPKTRARVDSIIQQALDHLAFFEVPDTPDK